MVHPENFNAPAHEIHSCDHAAYSSLRTLLPALAPESRIESKFKPGFGQKNGFRSCDGNFVFSRDLILKKVSELNGIVRIIVRSVCKQF